jgi:hypothetical protein
MLIAPEASRTAWQGLGSALCSVYAASADERQRLTAGDPSLDLYPQVVNDGVFVADRAALLSIDEALRGAPEWQAWVYARRDVWWRHKAALNLALARLDAASPLDPLYNVQLHVESQVPPEAKILHFSGTGRRHHGSYAPMLCAAQPLTTAVRL